MSKNSKWILAIAAVLFVVGMAAVYEDSKADAPIVEVPVPKKQRPGWPKDGMVNTKAEPGYDAQQINLWSSTSGDRQIRCEVRDRTLVSVVKEQGAYVYVQKQFDTTYAGWCMKGWISYTP